MNWTNYFINIANAVSLKSKDPSTKVGAIIVNPRNKQILSTGFNGFPRGVNDYMINPEIISRYDRPLKYTYTEHAERNAIYHAANHGIKVERGVLILNIHSAPCVDCARAIIQSGISKVIYGPMKCPAPKNVDNWRAELEHTKKMFNEAGVILKGYKEKDLDGSEGIEYEDPIFMLKKTRGEK